MGTRGLAACVDAHLGQVRANCMKRWKLGALTLPPLAALRGPSGLTLASLA